MAGESSEAPENLTMDNIPILAQQVFGIELLQEMILNYAIRGDNGQVCGSNVSTLRLVQKSWLETTTKVLQKSKESLFHLVLNGDNSLIKSVGGDGKLLDRFLNAMANKPSTPTFSVKITDDVFVQENHSTLSKMLVRFGEGVTQLELQIPVGSLSLEFIFPNFTLPNLGKLGVKLSQFGLLGRENCCNVSHFINSLLNAAPALTHFVVSPGSRHDVDAFPLAFQLFTLPPSITMLELSYEMSCEHLELLAKSDLPRLTSLILLIPGDKAYPDGLLFRILDKCRTTLQKLWLRGKTNWNTPKHVTILRFPVMEKLELVINYSAHCELETGTSSLETLLPKLSRLILAHNTAGMFRKWTENSCFKCKTLKFFPAQENVRPIDPEFIASVNLEMMQSIHVAFPNVRILELTVHGTQVCGLKYLFMEMKTLNDLRILVVGPTVGLDPNFWDALLIGVPIEFAKALQQGPVGFWEDAQLTSGSAPTIKNLQELKHLQLKTHRSCAHDPSVTEPLISDLTFLLALLKMPKLRELTFKGKFQASEEMAERWRSQGRKLTYTTVAK